MANEGNSIDSNGKWHTAFEVTLPWHELQVWKMSKHQLGRPTGRHIDVRLLCSTRIADVLRLLQGRAYNESGIAVTSATCTRSPCLPRKSLQLAKRVLH